MGGSITQSYLSDVLHVVSQGLLAPTIVLLLAFIGYALFCIGSVLVEYFTERRMFQVSMPKFLAALMDAEQDEIPQVIEDAGLLNRQKVALLTVYDYRTLPGDALVALIRRLVDDEETRYDRISGRNNMAARVSPMLGLMGTLIPLGPGIEALGRADTEALSSSLLIAFDTTVAGLVVAAVCLVIGKIRSNWYGNYMSALDAAMATMLQKIEDMRAAGEITVEEPSDYAFLFEQAHGRKAADKTASAKPVAASAAAVPKAEEDGSRAWDDADEDAESEIETPVAISEALAGAAGAYAEIAREPFGQPAREADALGGEADDARGVSGMPATKISAFAFGFQDSPAPSGPAAEDTSGQPQGDAE